MVNFIKLTARSQAGVWVKLFKAELVMGYSQRGRQLQQSSTFKTHFT